MTEVAILGAGMAGFGAAHRLHAEGRRSVMYEQKPYPGGHTASFHHAGGFIFDDGPHISFTKDARIQALFADSVHQQFETIHAYVNNYWQGTVDQASGAVQPARTAARSAGRHPV